MKRWRPLAWLVVSVVCFIAAMYFWRLGDQWQAQKPGQSNATVPPDAPTNPAVNSTLRMKSTSVQFASTAPVIALNPSATNAVRAKSTNAFPYRLSNSTQKISELSRNSHAILLENALIDTTSSQALAIPDSLRSHGDPGAFLVQADRPMNDALRAQIIGAGATIVSYIPNNAYLVTCSEAVAAQLGGRFTVLPWEPYYKVKASLMPAALSGQSVAAVNVAVFPGTGGKIRPILQKMGMKIASESSTPIGPLFVLQNVADITALARLPEIEEVEPSFARVTANDLTRVIMNDSVDVFVPANYLGLSGSNILVAVADSWVPTNGSSQFNLDLTNIIGDTTTFPFGIADFEGHATHVGGIIAGSGLHSPTNAIGSQPGADFRGKAPLATLFALPVFSPLFTDAMLQESAARTNALISNNSWGYGTTEYNLAAASYDQAVRDSLPGATGSQPLIYVFAAGNDGQGDDEGKGGFHDTLLSPAVAKNVISVGASELPRGITNDVIICDECNTDTNTPTCNTNKQWARMTDSSDQVAKFSARGNVGIGIEGDFGRFKPDLIAPGVFVVSTRSMTWDTNAYYNPLTVDTETFFGDTVPPNGKWNYTTPVPCDAYRLDISAVSVRPVNIDLPIYAKGGDFPQPPADLVGTNFVSIPNGILSLTPVDTDWHYSIGNPTNVPVTINVMSQVFRTNEMGDYWDVLRTNLNDQLASSNTPLKLYRYESGTSMAAPAVAGTLALMEEFFKNRWNYTPSPALMKALLINGARRINSTYDFQINADVNSQGWGLVNLTNSLPPGITNLFGKAAPMMIVDQDVTNALATGDTRTLFVQVNSNAQSAPLRITLVWTDPPGNPAASIKLVNNLDLIVTNLDSVNSTNLPVVFFGNDFHSGLQYSSEWDGNTNNLPSDNVNNVENVYIPGVLGTNYSITVIARNVNVNALTAHTNGVVQDYALVISSGNGDFTNALTLTDGPPVPTFAQIVSSVTNQFADSADTSGGLLTGQRAGASSPLQGAGTVALANQFMWGPNGQITLGVPQQWHFYVVTNSMGTNATTSFTNAAFATFLPPDLSIPQGGANATDSTGATRPEADIDLYVARGPNAWDLTNLNATVIAAADKSLSRGGTEFIVYSNAQPDEVFYIGVKAEDQEAAEYDFLALFSQFPFSQMGPNGEEYLRGMNVPTIIPDGTPNKPGIATTVAIAVQPIEVRRVVVTNDMEHQNFGDLLGTLIHNRIPVVLNNHTFGNGATNQELIYEDNDEGDVLGSQHPDGPGRLQDFIGSQGSGLWLLRENDNQPFSTGRVDHVFIRLDPQQGTNGVVATIPPGGQFIDFIDVPPEATNLTVYIDFLNGSLGPVQLYLRHGEQPTAVSYDYTQVFNAPGGKLKVGRTDLPPLRPGRYYVLITNPTLFPQTVRLRWSFDLDPNGAIATPITSTNSIMPLLDDATTNNSIFITNNQNIVTINVGVVLKHPRVSDLDLTLISPEGQRILLFENRGGPSATDMGHLNITTNFFPTTVPPAGTGQPNAITNTFGPVPPSGTLVINYDMFQEPDRMDVYYDGVDIFSTVNLNPPNGYISGPGTFTIHYGPGTSSDIVIVMNQAGNSGNPDTDYTYTLQVLTEDFTYLTFTDNTNLTQMPIKFALPPYDATFTANNIALSDFELATNGQYIPPGTTNIFDLSGGWLLTTNDIFVRTNYFAGTNLLSMATNEVSVVTDPGTAAGGSNYLALANGSISRNISLVPGKQYTISYLYRGPGVAGWCRGEGNATDSGDPETLGNNGSLVGRFNFPAGEVGQAFALEDSGLAFQFAGTNTYVQVRQSGSLDVGTGSGFTVEGWINPTNITFQQPLVEWLARVPTNTVVNGQSISNFVVQAGPFLNRANGHYYYLLGQTNWATSELWANALGGHLAEIDDANEQNWIYDTFAQFAGSNYTMWIGLTNNNPFGTNFVWSTGAGAPVYTNWAFGQPTNCATSHFVAILGPTNGLPGLWTVLDNNGLTCNGNPANQPLGVVEVNQIQTNGVQFWISVTNAATFGNGRLYANIFDTKGIPHELFSPPGLIQSNVYQHVALTYNTNTGVAKFYYAGTNVTTTNIGVFVPKTGGDVLLGKDMSRATNNFFWGRMDEMSIYSRFLSPAEIAAIYRISATTSNRNIGKFDPSITPAQGLAEMQVAFNGVTNLIFGRNKSWQIQGFTLVPTTDSVPLQFTGLEPGILLDSFNVAEHPPGSFYYLPEQPLQALVGSNAFGNWTLEIRDARTGAVSTNVELESWQLQFILETNIAPPIVIPPQGSGTNTVPPGQTAYFTVFVPLWANSATNILVSATAPVDLLFNENNPPGTGGPGDFAFLNNALTGSYVISALPPTTPPLIPGQTYYLGVRNNGAVPSTVVVQVNFDITTLTNGIPLTGRLDTNDLERPFIFNVHSNATEATFQLLQLVGNADLVLRKGLPLPGLLDADYGSFSGSNADETIYVRTNSLPVPLSAGLWYLDVIKRDDPTAPNTVRYAVLAKELTNAPQVINLTNRVPLNFTAGPGAALTNFFRFSVTNLPLTGATNLGIHFEVFNQSGNGDLTVQTNALPLAPPFLQSSRLPGNNAEIIFIRTNSAVTNLNADWYLGVPNNETNPISFTILAEIDTNSFAAFPTAEGAGAYTRGGALSTSVYHVTTLFDSGAGSLRGGVTSLTNGGTIVFDVSGSINLSAPLFITNSFLTIAGQTAPSNGVTVTGATTYVRNAHDIIMRYVRFRTNGAAVKDSLQITNASEIIVDHISAAYGTNDVVAILNSSNVTVQWSVVAESLNTTNVAPGGSEVRYGGGGVTFHHNLYADNYSGNPTIGEDVSLDFVNNVIFNWGIFSGLSTNDLVNNPGGLTNFLNYSANYLIAGSNSVFPNVAFWSATSNTWIFQTNNVIDTNRNSILDGANTSWGIFSNQYTSFSHAFDISPPTAPDEAFIAYEKVLDFVGTSMFSRDALDQSIVQRVRLRPSTKINSVLSGMVAWWKAESNTLDSVNANDGVANNIAYNSGEVGGAFQFDGSTSFITAPASPTLAVTNMTFEGWIFPTTSTYEPIVDYSGSGVSPAHFWVNGSGLTPAPGVLYANIRNTPLTLQTGAIVPQNAWSHVAFTLDIKTGAAVIYFNGVQAASTTLPLPVSLASTFVPVNIGYRSSSSTEAFAGSLFTGKIDEISIYNRALSPCEIAAIYNAGTAGKQSLLSSTNALPTSPWPYADVDQDGIPDFWEITLKEFPTNFSASLDRDGDGYTDLEEYMNWLGVPHAIALHDTSTNVDLYALSGNTGNLLFGVASGTNGTAYLTNLNACLGGNPHVAVFTPTNNFGNGTNCGFGSFTYMVTNTDTMAYFGPVTVSVFVSAVPITNVSITNILIFTNPPDIVMDEMTTNTVANSASPTNGVTYILLNPPSWATIDTNTGLITLKPLEPDGPTNVVITTVATDSSVPPIHATNSFSVTVNEVNRPPVFIGTPPNMTNSALVPITVINAATDPDIPINPLTYQLLNPPAGATIDTNTGIITWTPTSGQAPGTYTITTVVTDTNAFALVNNTLSATNTFTIVVVPAIGPFAFTQPAQGVTGTSAQLNGMATPNGFATVAWFEWGTNTLYGNQTAPVNVGSSFNVAYTTNIISGLIPNVPYHFRLVVSNGFGGIVTGFDQILDEARIVAWGADYVKQIEVPPGLSNVVAIAGAYDHSLALKNNGTVVAWGDNTFSQTNVPPGLNNVLAVAGGQYSSMALRNNGRVTAWGGNILSVTNVPAGLNNVVMIAGGTYASLALKNNGAVVSWGANFFNLTNLPAGLNNVVEVAGGSYHSLAIRNDGTVVAWGDNSAGQTNVPPSATNVVAIAGGNYHSLALRSDGTVVAWGDNGSGQTNVPPGLSNVVAVAAGGFHSMVLKSDGTVVSWGDNTAGQSDIPAGLSNVVAISSGYFHSLALTPTLLSTNPIVLNITNGVPRTNTVFGNSIVYYRVDVPMNADAATNTLLFALNGPLNVWYSTNTPPTTGQPNDFQLLTNVFTGTSVVDTATSPQLLAGKTYYLGLQNTNGFAVSYVVQVDFDLVPITPLTNGVPLTNAVPSGGLIFYQVDVPTNADFATNLLFSGTGPLNLWFSTNVPPTITNADDILLLSNVVNGTSILNGASTPQLIPGTTYYLGVENTNASAVTYGIGVNFHLLGVTPPQTNTVPISGIVHTNINGTNGFLLVWFAPTNDLFQVQWSPGLPPSWSTFTNIIGYHLFINPTNSEFEFFDDGSQTGGSLGSGRIYRLILLGSSPAPTQLIGGVPVSNSIPSGAISFYQVNVPTNADFATNSLLSGTGPLNVWFSTNNPPTVTNANDFLLITHLSSGFSTLSGTTSPRLIPGGTYYLGVQNTNAVTVSYAVQVDFHLAPTGPTTNSVPISTITRTNINGTNGFLLVWFAPTNALFQVQWTPGLPPSWSTFTNIIGYHTFISPTNSEFEFFDDGSQTGGSLGLGRIYRLILLGSAPATNNPATNAIPPISSITTTNIGGTNNFLLVWFAPTNELFQVQWSAGLPPSWFTFTNIIRYDTFISATNSKFIFLDDGSQTGGFGTARYYRLIPANSTNAGFSILQLANGVPVNFTTGVGQTNFFSFDITQTNAAVLFELYNLTGNGDLTLQINSLPLTAPYFTNSSNSGTNYEQIVVRTNASVPNINAISWFLGVPNQSLTPISYTIRAVIPTNGILVSGVPLGTVTSRPGGSNVQLVLSPTIIGEKYEIRTNSSLTSPSWGAITDIVASGTSTTFTDPSAASGVSLFYWVVQVP